MTTATAKPTGLEGVTAGDTSICQVEQTSLIYRGYEIADLAEHATFEEVAFLLLEGHKPSAHELGTFTSQLVAERMMVNRLRLEAGLEVPTHAHDNEQIVLVLRGRLRLHVGTDEREVILSDDEAYVLPANVPHRAEALEDCEVFDLFSPPTESTGIDA